MIGLDRMGFDVITIGRSGVDLYPLQIGVELERVESFGKFLGGSPTNVAVAAARHGRRTVVITRTGDDAFGRFIKQELRTLGVDDRWVAAAPGMSTPVAFCEIFPPNHFPLYFYGRHPTCPDLQIRASDLSLSEIPEAAILWVTGTGLSQEPSRSAHLTALHARGGRTHTILDLDYREGAWESTVDARAHIAEALPYATVAVGNIEECAIAVGESDPFRAAEALIGHGVDLAVVKKGPEGVLARTATEIVEVAPFQVDVLNGLGAGDAFGGALCHGLLAGWPLGRVVRFANVAGAIVASRLECARAMPTEAEVRAHLSNESRDSDAYG